MKPRRPRGPYRTGRFDYLAQAERELYPLVPVRRLSRLQRSHVNALAKARAIRDGLWPESGYERTHGQIRGAA